ncbi:MAG: hypothetical protein KJ634_13775 [Gammaproteobacteria bacterium]|nr:hypothetical protein [Gammaproteobacteria bacterium]MBU1416685.1 hypothetical protein [Gammaproteobacteria bacterium]
MIRDRGQFASYIAVTYIFVVLGGIFLHYLSTGDAYTLKFSLMLPSTLGAIIISGVVAWGLWNRFRWAWWLGIVAALFQLVRMSSWLSQHFSAAKLPGFGVLLVLALVLVFLIVLILPGTRAACAR